MVPTNVKGDLPNMFAILKRSNLQFLDRRRCIKPFVPGIPFPSKHLCTGTTCPCLRLLSDYTGAALGLQPLDGYDDAYSLPNAITISLARQQIREGRPKATVLGGRQADRHQVRQPTYVVFRQPLNDRISHRVGQKWRGLDRVLVYRVEYLLYTTYRTGGPGG
jgi:hypothetical protein